MKSLFEYDSYRRYLGDFFQDMKARRSSFSYRSFSRKAGFSSCGFCHQVVTGERGLTDEATEKMIVGIGANGKKAQYFKALVRYEQAKRPEDKEKAFAEMNALRKDSSFFRLNRSHLRYFEHWWYPVLRNLVVYAPWGNDYALLANLVEPPISEVQAKRGVEVMQELDLVERDDRGRWRLTNTLVTSADIPVVVKSETRKDVFQLGLESLERFSSHERHATYYTLGLKGATYLKLVEMIEELNSHATAMASEDEDIDRVYELGVLLYPLSKRLGKTK